MSRLFAMKVKLRTGYARRFCLRHTQTKSHEFGVGTHYQVIICLPSTVHEKFRSGLMHGNNKGTTLGCFRSDVF